MGRIVSGSAAAIVLLCFFLPWATVSCSGQELMTVSGLDMASGVEVSGQQVEGETILYAIPLAVLVILGLLVVAANNAIGAGIGQITASIVGLLILFLKWSSLTSNAQQQGMEVSAEIGFFGTVVGFIVVIIGALLIMQEKSKSTAGGQPYGGHSSSFDDW